MGFSGFQNDLEITGAIAVCSSGRYVVFSAETKGPDEKTFFDDSKSDEKTWEIESRQKKIDFNLQDPIFKPPGLGPLDPRTSGRVQIFN